MLEAWKTRVRVITIKSESSLPGKQDSEELNSSNSLTTAGAQAYLLSTGSSGKKKNKPPVSWREEELKSQRSRKSHMTSAGQSLSQSFGKIPSETNLDGTRFRKNPITPTIGGFAKRFDVTKKRPSQESASPPDDVDFTKTAYFTKGLTNLVKDAVNSSSKGKSLYKDNMKQAQREIRARKEVSAPANETSQKLKLAPSQQNPPKKNSPSAFGGIKRAAPQTFSITAPKKK